MKPFYALSLIFFVVLSGCTKTYQPSEDVNRYANKVVSYENLWDSTNVNEILGKTNHPSTKKLGTVPLADGWIIVDMGKGEEVVDSPGKDLRIYETDNSYGGSIDSVDSFAAESYSIFVSNDLKSFKKVGGGSGTKSFDIAKTGLSKARFIKLKGNHIGGNPASLDQGGPDIDAVEAIHMYSDNQKPSVHIRQPQLTNDNSYRSQVKNVLLKGSVQDDSSIEKFTINDSLVGVKENGEFETVVELDVGINHFILLAEDARGLKTTNSITISYNPNQNKPKYTHASSPNGFPIEAPAFYVKPQISGIRTALIIGNGDYEKGTLKNPVNDARDMSALLSKFGFSVSLLIDADIREMKESIKDFGRKLRDGGIGFFYYAGHGVQIEGTNYLIPYNADIDSEGDIQFEGVHVGRILAKMKDAGNKANIVILDACRNNPYSRMFRNSIEGLAKMDAAVGTLIAYSTAPGGVAMDGVGSNGLYTASLLHHLSLSGISLQDALMRTRKEVVMKTNGSQVPWESSSLLEKIYLSQ